MLTVCRTGDGGDHVTQRVEAAMLVDGGGWLPALLLLLFYLAESRVDNNVRYDNLIGRHMNVFTPYDGAKLLVI